MAEKNGRKGSADGAPELEKTFLVKVVAYGRGLEVGLGIKPLAPDVLKQALAVDETRAGFQQMVSARIQSALADAGIAHGLNGDAISEAAEAFVTRASHGDAGTLARQIGTGEAPTPGEDGRFEYVLNPDDRPMREIEGEPRNSTKCWFHHVAKDETLVRAIPATEGKPGTNVKGEAVPPPKPKQVSLSSIRGPHTRIDGDRLVADMDGCCIEDAEGRVRVSPETRVECVDASTQSIPEAGVARGSVLVEKAIRSGYGVTCSEAVFVGTGGDGLIEKKAHVVCRHLFVRGGVLGNGGVKGAREDATLDVHELAVVERVEGAVLQAGRIVVTDECRFARIDADTGIFVAGDLIGGRTYVRSTLSVTGNLGTPEGGSQTRIVIPAGTATRRRQRLERQVRHAATTLAEYQEKLVALNTRAQKRCAADPYFSSLFAGDIREPERPVEANTYRQFLDYQNERKTLERRIAQTRRHQAALAGDVEEEAEAAESDTRVRVWGKLHLDVTFEVSREVDSEDLDAKVRFTAGGKNYLSHPLRELKNALSQEARTYLEQQGAQVAERKQALDQMFRDAENRPSGPEVADRIFSLPFSWSDTEAEKSSSANAVVDLTASVRAHDPDTLVIRTAGSLREIGEAVHVTIGREGPRCTFNITPLEGSPPPWQSEEGVAAVIDATGIGAASAREFLRTGASDEVIAQAEPEEPMEPEDEAPDTPGGETGTPAPASGTGDPEPPSGESVSESADPT